VVSRPTGKSQDGFLSLCTLSAEAKDLGTVGQNSNSKLLLYYRLPREIIA
jgi:hypothetical protein